MDLCFFCGARHADQPPCAWQRVLDHVTRQVLQSEARIHDKLFSISERIDQIIMDQSALDTELTAVEAAEKAEETQLAAEEVELTQESADLKTLLAAIPPGAAINLAPEIARLQALATTMGARTTSATTDTATLTTDDASITAETAVLEPPAAPAPSVEKPA